MISVLLIEDNETDVELMKKLLKGFLSTNVNLSIRKTLAESIAALQVNTYHLIMADLHLPDSDGVQTVEKLVPAAVGVPVVVLTGSDDDALIEQCILAGAYTYLNKNESNGNIRRAIIAAKAVGERQKTREKKFIEVIQESFPGLDIKFGAK